MLVGTLLYAQMAVAAYACPALVSTTAAGVSMVSTTLMAATNDDQIDTSTSAPMSDCAGMQGSVDPSAQKLCAEHCMYGHQSDLTSGLTLPTVLMTPLYVAQPLLLASVPWQRAADLSAHLSALAEASPPLAVLHCRFQI